MNNLRETLIELLEAEASRKQIDYVLKIVGEDEDAISLLVDLALFGKYPHANRAAWTLDILDRKHSELLDSHIEKLLKNLPNIKSDSIKRPVFSILSKRKLPKRYQGFLINYCFTILQSNSEKIASKVFSMEILAKIAENEPDLLGELFSVINLQYPDASAGFRARARKLWKRFS